MATNGNGRIFKIVMWLAGVIVSAVILSVSMIGRNVIANDRDSRTRDTEIRVDFNKHCIESEHRSAEYAIKQEAHNGKTNVVLERILVTQQQLVNTLENIEKNGR